MLHLNTYNRPNSMKHMQGLGFGVFTINKLLQIIHILYKKYLNSATAYICNRLFYATVLEHLDFRI